MMSKSTYNCSSSVRSETITSSAYDNASCRLESESARSLIRLRRSSLRVG